MSRIDALIAGHCPDGVVHKPLGEVGEFVRGSGIQKKDFVESGVGCIHYGQIYTHYGTSATETKSFVTPEHAAKLRLAQTGDLVLATTSENPEDVCKAVAWLGDSDIAVSGDAYIYRHSLDPLYAAYLFQTASFESQKMRFITGTKVKRVSGDALSRIKVPVPPVAIQEEIAGILASMEQLEAELEAELEARRQQYEYFRGSLLRFEERAEDEVKWLALGEAVEVLDSLRRPITRAEREPGNIPYYGANGVQDHVADHIFDGTFLLMGEDGSVVREDGTPVINWATGKIWVNNHAHVLGERPGVVKLRFLYHYLQTVPISSLVGSSRPKLTQGKLRQIRVPVPRVRVQDELVGLLDNFDSLVSDLTSGLPAEITARRKQYEYYRDRLLTFPEATA